MVVAGARPRTTEMNSVLLLNVLPWLANSSPLQA